MDAYVHLVAKDAAGQVVLETDIPYLQWYDGDNPLIDETDERLRLGIRSLEGTQYRDGALDSHWRVTYGADGEYEDSETFFDAPIVRPSVQPGRSAYDQLKELGMFAQPAASKPAE